MFFFNNMEDNAQPRKQRTERTVKITFSFRFIAVMNVTQLRTSQEEVTPLKCVHFT